MKKSASSYNAMDWTTVTFKYPKQVRFNQSYGMAAVGDLVDYQPCRHH